MNTRGAPAIAITGCLALAVELVNLDFDSISAFDQFVTEKLGLARNLALEGTCVNRLTDTLQAAILKGGNAIYNHL